MGFQKLIKNCRWSNRAVVDTLSNVEHLPAQPPATPALTLFSPPAFANVDFLRMGM